MSKTWEHYDLAARHHERAAHEFKDAAKYHETEEHEKAAHHAYLAHGHNQHAVHHGNEVAKLYTARNNTDTPAAEQEAKKECRLKGSFLYPWTSGKVAGIGVVGRVGRAIKVFQTVTSMSPSSTHAIRLETSSGTRRRQLMAHMPRATATTTQGHKGHESGQTVTVSLN
jgi:hypothetical protein